ncbi:MAG: hypothetical protein IPL46_23900 [Saprospiraceae bacterium]|nr:hypothetical protein [Saprospiraceae bacterium]
MNTSLTKLLNILSVILLVGMISCRQDNAIVDPPLVDPTVIKTSDFDYQIALEWMTLFLDMERFTAGYFPPVSGRAAAYVGMAGYEAALPGMDDDFNTLEGQLPGLELPHIHPDLAYHWPSAVHAAYSTVVTHLFPTAPAAQQQRLLRLNKNTFPNLVQLCRLMFSIVRMSLGRP